MAVTTAPARPIRIPRAPRSMPLVGHALALARDPLAFLKSLTAAAPNGVVRVDLGTIPGLSMPVYAVTTPEAIGQVLTGRTAASIEKGWFFERLRPLSGNGLSNADNETHKPMRRLMQPEFAAGRIGAYVPAMDTNVRELVAVWESGQAIDMYQAMARYAIGTVASAFFSTEVGSSGLETIHRQLPVVLDTLMPRALTPKQLERLPLGYNRRFDSAVAKLNQVIDEIIANRRGSGEDEAHEDLLARLVRAGLDDVQLRDEVSTVMYAGAETTAAVASWTLWYLGQQPQLQQQAVTEIREVVGDRGLTVDDVPKLTVLDRALRETMRLHSVPLLMRRTLEPVEIGGHLLPKGAEIIFSLYALHTDKKIFGENAEEYDADRWKSARQRGEEAAAPGARRPTQREYIPFGAGARKCIGDQFALVELVFGLATILRQWKLAPVAGVTPREIPSSIARPDRVPMIVQRRTS